MSGTVSASMNCLSLQTPSKKFRRNREELQPGEYLPPNFISTEFIVNYILVLNSTVTTSKICLVGTVKCVAEVDQAAQVNKYVSYL